MRTLDTGEEGSALAVSQVDPAAKDLPASWEHWDARQGTGQPVGSLGMVSPPGFGCAGRQEEPCPCL